jgi:tripartite motif-containing protein 71
VLLGGLVALLVVAAVGSVFYFTMKKNPSTTGALPPVPTQAAAVGGTDNGGKAPPVQTQQGAVGQATVAPAKPEPPTIDLKATPASLFDHGTAGGNKGQLNEPRGIAQDASGNFFVADTQNLRVEKFDKTGKFVTMFGSKGNADGQFNPISDEGTGTGPGGVAVDKAGNVYVADTWNHRIQKFDNNGKFLAKWGSFLSLADPAAPNDTDANNKLYGPRGLAIGPDGNLYVVDTGNKRVMIYDTNGKFVRKIDSGMSPTKKGPEYPFNKPGELNEPIGVAVDGAGNVYVADTNNHRIQKFDKDGKPSAQWPVPDKDWAPGPTLEPFVALDGAGNLYATAPSGKTVIKYTSAGKEAGEKNKEGATTLQLPTGIWVTADGTIYVVDTAANSVVNLGKMP